MVDIHNHILYGTDDGARNIEESLAMLNKAREMGYKKIVATSHYPRCDEKQRKKSYEVLKKEAEKVGIELFLGREIMITPEILEKIVERKLGSMAGSRYLLIEFQVGTIEASSIGAVKSILGSGYIPIIAHVERYGWHIKNLLELKKLGAVLQMNIRAGARGKTEWKKWIRYGLIDILATDAHREVGRSYDLSEEICILKDLLGMDEFERLTYINPGRILDDEELIMKKDQLEKFMEKGNPKETAPRGLLRKLFKR